MRVIQLSRLHPRPEKVVHLRDWPLYFEAMEDSERENSKFWGWIARKGSK